jgi:hypothetical protein
MGNYADVNGVHMYYETHGVGDPILLLHGGMGGTHSGQAQVLGADLGDVSPAILSGFTGRPSALVDRFRQTAAHVAGRAHASRERPAGGVDPGASHGRRRRHRPARPYHAIGEDAFLVELQEPTDLSILLEWAGFAIDGSSLGHLGLGFPTALGAVDRRGWSRATIENLRGARAGDTGDLLPDAAEFFQVERSRGQAEWEPGYAVLVVVAGYGELVTAERIPIHRGQTALVPFAAGSCRIDGAEDLEILCCRPPRPRSGPRRPR